MPLSQHNECGVESIRMERRPHYAANGGKRNSEFSLATDQHGFSLICVIGTLSTRNFSNGLKQPSGYFLFAGLFQSVGDFLCVAVYLRRDRFGKRLKSVFDQCKSVAKRLASLCHNKRNAGWSPFVGRQAAQRCKRRQEKRRILFSHGSTRIFTDFCFRMVS